MTAPSTLDAVIDTLGPAALRGEISWLAVDRILELAEESQLLRELETAHREWLDYAERIRQLDAGSLSAEEAWREFNLARAYWLAGHQVGWLEDWQRRLQSAQQRLPA